MKYFDFDIALEKESDGSYCVRVVNSPSGEASAEFHVPLSDLELENFRLKLARTGRAVRSVRQQDIGAIRDYGTRLYESLLTGEVENCFRASLAKVRGEDATAGLRVRLRLRDAAELAGVPWEYIYQPSSRTYLALRDDTPFVRYLEMSESVRPLSIAAPLRVLVLISSPANLDRLEAEHEWERLQQSLAQLEEEGLVELHRLRAATIRELRWELKRGEYHVFHFIGHGGVAADGSGLLYFEDEERQAVEFSAEKLGVLLREEKTLRLAVLNACEGGAASNDDIFSGTAQSLIQQEIPAVVAMQFEISDDGAITFSHEFYQALAHGDPIDAAVTWARRAMFTQGDEVEWGTPVLYMRAPDGRLFDVQEPGGDAHAAVRGAPHAADPVAALPRRPRRAESTPTDSRIDLSRLGAPRGVPVDTSTRVDQPVYADLPVHGEVAAYGAYGAYGRYAGGGVPPGGGAPPGQYVQPPPRRWWQSRKKVAVLVGVIALIAAGLVYVYVPNRDQEAIRAGYTIIKAWQEAQLGHFDSIAYTVALQPNYQYLILGACDLTCDLNIYVEDGPRATHASRRPQVDFTTSAAAPPRAVVVVKAERCSSEPCYYGWGIYGRPAPQ